MAEKKSLWDRIIDGLWEIGKGVLTATAVSAALAGVTWAANGFSAIVFAPSIFVITTASYGLIKGVPAIIKTIINKVENKKEIKKAQQYATDKSNEYKDDPDKNHCGPKVVAIRDQIDDLKTEKAALVASTTAEQAKQDTRATGARGLGTKTAAFRAKLRKEPFDGDVEEITENAKKIEEVSSGIRR